MTIYPLRMRKINIQDNPEWEMWYDNIWTNEFQEVAEYFKEHDTIEPWLMARAMKLPEALKLRDKILKLQAALNSNRPKKKRKKKKDETIENEGMPGSKDSEGDHSVPSK